MEGRIRPKSDLVMIQKIRGRFPKSTRPIFDGNSIEIFNRTLRIMFLENLDWRKIK